MKKVFFMLLCALLLSQWSYADKKIYTTDTLQLPEKARRFIAEHFPGVDVSHIKIEKEFWEGKQYDVILTNGFDLDFDSKGEWKEVDGHRSVVPVSVVPVKIAEYVNKNFPQRQIISIDRDKSKYEVKLTDGKEVEFDRSQRFIRFDD